MSRFRFLTIFAIPGFAFFGIAAPTIAYNSGFDESSISSVWHKAKLRGVSFRAIGQEPAWLLEITDGSDILLVLDYGKTKSNYPYVEPVVYAEERRTQFIIEGDDLTIEIRGQHCQDVMSGEEFAVSVTIIMTDRQLTGCGRALY